MDQMDQQKQTQVLALTVKAGEILLRSGAEIFRVQDTMQRIAEAYEVRPYHVYVVSNGIFASVEAQGNFPGTQVRNIPYPTVHLGRVAAVNSLSREIAEGRWSADEAMARLCKIECLPFLSVPLQILASGVGSGGFCILYGGAWVDALSAFIAGVLLWAFVLFTSGKGLSKIMTNLLSSAIAALCGILFVYIGLGAHLDKVIIGSIVPLLPGVPLTTSIRDFLNGDYISGTIHLIDALLVAACIAIGVGFVLKAGTLLTGGPLL